MRTPKPVSHGGNILAVAQKLGCNVDDLIDMSSNLTPFGMAPGLKEIIVERLDEIAYLPETGSESVIHCFAETFKRPQSQVIAGNGTTEFIFGLPAAVKPERAVIVNPTYADYHLACSWAAIDIVDYGLSLENDFVCDLRKLGSQLENGDMVFICNPNNPTGQVLASEELHDFCGNHPKVMFLVDESYMPFVREKSLLELPQLDNLMVLSSYSKIYGIPGLRLGFLTASEKIMATMTARRKPWGVNRVAQIAGEFLCNNAEEYVEDVLRFLDSERVSVVKRLKEISGVRVIGGKANFILCYLEGEILAPQLQRRLLEKKIMIRNCANFVGLNERFFRISLKKSPENSICIAAIQEILEE